MLQNKEVNLALWTTTTPQTSEEIEGSYFRAGDDKVNMTFLLEYDDEVIKEPFPVVVEDYTQDTARYNGIIKVYTAIPEQYSGSYGEYPRTVVGSQEVYKVTGTCSRERWFYYQEERPPAYTGTFADYEVGAPSQGTVATPVATPDGISTGSLPVGRWSYIDTRENLWKQQNSLGTIIVNNEEDYGKVWAYIYTGDPNLLDKEPDLEPENDEWNDDPDSAVTDNPFHEPTVTAVSCSGACNFYAVTPAELEQFFSWFWNGMVDTIISSEGLLAYLSGFFDNLQKCITGIYLYPFEVSHGGSEPIKLGRYSTGSSPVLTKGIEHFGTYKRKVSRFYNNFIDFQGYTRVGLYLPYIGYRDIDVNLFMGNTLAVDYFVDYTNGACDVYVSFIDKKGSSCVVDHFSGRMGVAIPYSLDMGKDLNRINSDAFIGNVVNATKGIVGSAVSGNPGGMLTAVAGAELDQYFGRKVDGDSTHYYSATSNQNILEEPTKIQLVFIRPTYEVPENYGESVGYVENKTRKLGSCNGFTQAHNVRLHFGHTETEDGKTVYPTDEEKDMIKSYLEKGVYL